MVPSLTDTVSKELQAWSKMETIKTEIRVPLVQYMLSSVTFSSLTRITVRFPRTDTNCVIAKAAQIESFLKNIANAPTLQYLELDNLEFDLQDLEQLHKNATNLQHLVLGWLDLSPPNETPTNFAILKDDTLESLCIKLSLFRIYQNALREWILYIGKKYRKFQKLDMAYILNDRHGALDLEDALVQMINSQQWTDLKTFGPENDDYVAHIQSSRLQATVLKKLRLIVDGMDAYADMFPNPVPVIGNLNLFLSGLLDMCPLLEEFKLLASHAICNPGDVDTLNLDLKNKIIKHRSLDSSF